MPRPASGRDRDERPAPGRALGRVVAALWAGPMLALLAITTGSHTLAAAAALTARAAVVATALLALRLAAEPR